MLATVRHTLSGSLGEVMRTSWSPFVREPSAAEGAGILGWMAVGQVRSNVPVVAVAELDGIAPWSGWRLRDGRGALVAWDGRPTEVSAPLAPGARDVEVLLVPPAGEEEQLVRVRLRVVPVPHH